MTDLNRDTRPNPEFALNQFLLTAFSPPVNDFIKHIGILRQHVSEDAVHDTRVAIRTIRSHFKTFSPLIRKKIVKQLDQELRWINKRVAPVRDADVLIGIIKKLELIDDNVEFILHLLERERQEKSLLLTNALAKQRLDALMTQLVYFALQPPVRRKQMAKSPQERKALVTICISHTWVDLFSAITNLPKKPKPRELHKVRIMAKRCRYAYQVSARTQLLPSDHIEEYARSLQQKLGSYNDKVELKRWIKKQTDVDSATSQMILEKLNVNKFLSKKKLLKDNLSGFDSSIESQTPAKELT